MDLPLSQELLQYYRDKLEKSEHEYQEALEALEKIQISHQDYHKLSWDLHKKSMEIEDLQKTLSEAQNFLFEERKQLLKALAENDELKMQELKDRKKIRYLLSMYGLPDQDETTYFKEELEKRFVRQSSKPSRVQGGPELELEGIDHEDEESLRLRCKALRAQLDEQSRMYEETIVALKQDQEIMRQEKKVAHEQANNRIEELLEKVERLQNFCRENTRELLQVKKGHKIAERRSKEDRAKLVEELSRAKLHLGEERGKNTTMERNIETKVSRKNESLIGEMRQTIARYENTLEDQKSKSMQKDQNYAREIDGLKERLKIASGNIKSLQKRRHTEIQGFTADIGLLKKQIQTLEKQILKVSPLEDREMEMLGIAKQTGSRAAHLSGVIHDIKSKLYETERELRALPI